MTTSAAPAAIYPERPRRTGRTAFTMAILVVVLSIGLAVTMGVLAAPYVDHRGGGAYLYLSATSPDGKESLLAVIALGHVLVGSVFGIWALVLGIIAAATGRGRRPGIAAIVIAAITPLLSLALYFGIAVATS